MNFSVKDRHLFLKAYTDMLREINGKGPKNIHVELEDDGITIVMGGVITPFERYLLDYFGEEALSALEHFYLKSGDIAAEKFNERIDFKYHFSYEKLEMDFENDVFKFKMKCTK